MSEMNVYTCTSFKGHYPVGTAAVVVATDQEHAASLLEQLLAENRLSQKIPLGEIRFFCAADEHAGPNARLLNDGEY